MRKSKLRPLPRWRSLDALVEFFDTHDLGEYWDEMPAAHFQVGVRRRAHLVAIDSKLAERLTAIARSRHTSSEGLINAWLREKIREQAETPE